MVESKGKGLAGCRSARDKRPAQCRFANASKRGVTSLAEVTFNISSGIFSECISIGVQNAISIRADLQVMVEVPDPCAGIPALHRGQHADVQFQILSARPMRQSQGFATTLREIRRFPEAQRAREHVGPAPRPRQRGYITVRRKLLPRVVVGVNGVSLRNLTFPWASIPSGVEM
jgi:hypothetical protein